MNQATNSFRSLLTTLPGSDAGETQRRAAQLLPERVKASPFDLWPTDAVPNGTGNRLLVGVAVWSVYDLTLLDLLEDAARHGHGAGTPIGVFNIDQLESADLDRLLPGIGFVHHSPVVGHWVGGKLVEKSCGFHARELVARLFGLDSKAMIERPEPAGA
ncbi:hypothetical protein [Gemmata sp.]|uniref:hypothetical protein n=1 Tax=Gemmata sp. TaxID=1914242 RepID=UPI003F70DD6E